MRWIRHILVPVDFSPASLAAYRYARFLAAHVGACVDVLYVIPPQAGGLRSPAGPGGSGGARPGRYHRRVRAFLSAPGDVRVLVATGDLVLTTMAALRWSYEVVVVGGDSPIGEIADEAPCRVVTVWAPEVDAPVPFALDRPTLDPVPRWLRRRQYARSDQEAACVAG